MRRTAPGRERAGAGVVLSIAFFCFPSPPRAEHGNPVASAPQIEGNCTPCIDSGCPTPGVFSPTELLPALRSEPLPRIPAHEQMRALAGPHIERRDSKVIAQEHSR